MELKILKHPDPLLRKRSAEVHSLNEVEEGFIDNLIDTMRAGPGCVGVAAPQVGVLKRIIVVDVTPKNKGYGLLVMINPVITSMSGKKIVREGCLSVPEYTAKIRRSHKISVTGLDRDMNPLEVESRGFEAVVLQHEIDHLDGVLFIDRITNIKDELLRRPVKKSST